MALTALQSASTGLSALNTQLDVISNNLANVNTTGFKSSRANFQDLLYMEKAQAGTENANSDIRPTGLYVGLGVKVSGTQLDFTQGALLSTGRDLDVAIDGLGFLQVEVEPDFARNGVAYTRAGNLAVNPDGDLVLANDQGRRVLPRVSVPDDAIQIDIASTGEIVITLAGGGTQIEGPLELANFVNPAGLKQIGENLYAETEGSGPPTTGEPGEDNFGRIVQGFLEGSNVDPTRELIELIRTQRAFEMNSQTIRAADETMQTVSQLRR